MIKLNLLPEPDPSLTTKRAVFVISVSISSLAVLVLIIFRVFLGLEVSFIEEDISRMESLASSLREKNRESQYFEETVLYLNSLADEISKIKLAQLGISELLIEISKKIPDKVWLTSIIKDFNTLRLTGYALSDFDLATFQKGLETAHLFEKVELISSITVYLLKQFAYDSLSKNLIMSISESKDQGRFASLIQNKAKDVGLNVIKSAPPSGILELEENQLNQTKLGWTQTSKQSSSGMYIWSKNEMLEAKSFILEATINFKKIINSRKENES